MLERHSVPDKYDDVVFNGTLIGSSSTENPDSVRWTEINIYRTEHGKYVIHRSGRSVLYHRHDGVCNTGVPRAVDTLDAELSVPCARCRPGQLSTLTGEMVVDMELNKDSVDICEAHEVYDTLLLRRRDRLTGKDTTFMSNPSQRAFEQALMTDDHLRQVTRTVRQVS